MRTPFRVFVSVLALASSACTIDVRGDGSVKTEEKRFTVSGEPDLNLHTFDGSIQLRSWDRNEVLVEIQRRGPDDQTAEALVVNVTQEGNRIVIDAPGPKGTTQGIHFGRWTSPSVDLIVTSPKKLKLEARTGDGSIAAEDLVGAVSLDSGDGSIRVRHLEGTVRIRSGDGSISVSDAVGSLSANSGDGSITLNGRLDSLDVHTGDGSVSAEILDGSTLKNDWSIDTGDGSISLRVPSNLDADVDAHTGDGSVNADWISGADNNNQRDEERRSLKGRIGKGGHAFRLRSGDGSINITR